MDEIPDAKRIVENQIADALAKVRQSISSSTLINFEETYEPPNERGVLYWGKAVLEFIGAYAKDGQIAVLVWVRESEFPDQVIEEFWNMLSQRVYEELIKKVPDLKFFTLEAYFFDSLRDLEEAAIQGEEL